MQEILIIKWYNHHLITYRAIIILLMKKQNISINLICTIAMDYRSINQVQINQTYMLRILVDRDHKAKTHLWNRSPMSTNQAVKRILTTHQRTKINISPRDRKWSTIPMISIKPRVKYHKLKWAHKFRSIRLNLTMALDNFMKQLF